MQLKKLSIQENEFKNGLKAVKMDNLGQIVALFGANGAGKTRLLNSVKTVIAKHNRKMANSATFLRSYRLKSEVMDAYMSDIRQKLKALTAKAKQTKKAAYLKSNLSKISTERRELLREANKVRALARTVKSNYRPQPENEVEVIDLTQAKSGPGQKKPAPRGTSLKATVAKIRALARLDTAPTTVLCLLSHLAKSTFCKEHPKIRAPEAAEKRALLFEEARRITKIMMDMDLDYTVEGGEPYHPIPTLNGRKVDLDELSAGQSTILSYVGFFLAELLSRKDDSETTTLRDAIIMLDEPEVHLHPQAVTSIINSMRDLVGKDGQVWIATHAVCLLPHLRRNEIWTMEDGKVNPPGIEAHHRAVHLLVGPGEDFEKLRSFLQEPYYWAAVRFSGQCLLAPEKVGFTAGDPQLFQVSGTLAERLNQKKKVTIVDYGAGKARLATMFREVLENTDQKRVVYVPVEPDESCHAGITQAAGHLLAQCGVTKDGSSLLANYGGQADAVVLCNVLHEIHPKDWVSELQRMRDLLSPYGSLILCEDLQVPIGELPHETGFVILGPDELAILFSLDKRPRLKWHPDDKYKDRLLCLEIPRDEMKVSKETVEKALTALQARLTESVRQMRQPETKRNAKEGRKYALHAHMLVNCKFALEDLQRTNNK